jgi:arsenate reductase (thioredoxin)
MVGDKRVSAHGNDTGEGARRNLFPGLAEHLEGLTATLERIEEPYRSAGQRLAEWIAATRQPGEPLRVVVVCTGNSRRSMLGAMMGNAAASFHGLPEIQFFSAGTTPSAFNPRTIAALQAVGFQIEPIGDEAPRGAPELPNPRCRVRWGIGEGQEIVEFSKALGDPALPASSFATLMVCDEADAACPVVPGAVVRISMPLPDPKAADDTPEEGARYAATRDTLGRLMLAVLGESLRRIKAP